MSNFEIFERELIGKDGNTKKINEVIDIAKHTWTTMDGNIIMKHEAVLLLRKFTGAKFLKPELQVQISNPGNVIYLCSVEFPDGEISYEIGESNNENTKGWSKGIKPTMAFKRGYDRAFLRSDYIGLFEVYSEEESDSFKRPESTTPPLNNEQPFSPDETRTEENNDFSNQTQKQTMNQPHPALFLPGTDPKYPGEHIVEDVLKRHQDFDYLNEIPQNYPNNEDYMQIVDLIQKKREAKLKQKQEEAEVFLNSESPLQHSEHVDETISREAIPVKNEQSTIFTLEDDISDINIEKEDKLVAEDFLNGDETTYPIEKDENTILKDTDSKTEDINQNTETVENVEENPEMSSQTEIKSSNSEKKEK
ncbi:hypothetical protein CON36_22040 [Bacillus cereus]|uniref:Uncharacterized protein n=2 Tax=Bacillus cereus group TaxID=86661 RepID=A0A9X6ZQ96_BACTU|nr:MULTISPECIES: hypothetical protein [Bacillus cereus group]PDZ96603.1 hypothetical protein CON36_22040 [Bacillus cereus]PFJ29159.1 hypothetical protein COJ15_32105 [Bacillus thuringiensis]